jgi:hypothetical protein
MPSPSARSHHIGTARHHRDGTASVYIKDPWGKAIEIVKAKSLGQKNERFANIDGVL